MSTTLATAKIDAGTWTLDPLHSSVGFRVKHFGLTWLRGTFPEFELSASVDESRSVQLAGSTATEAISFADPTLHGHLMSPDFFDAELNPKLTFSSSSVSLDDDGSATVRGELTMRGTTKPIELTGTWSAPTEGLGGDTRFGLELHGELDRFDYGISWAANLPSGADVIGRKVRLEGEFELVQG